MLVSYNNEVFRVDSASDMYNHIKELLTDEESSKFVPLGYWINVAEYVHQEDEFIEELVKNLFLKEEIEYLNYAINISNHASGSASVFWDVLYKLDDLNLYPKAIIAACKTYDLECMIDELMEYLIADGENMFNEMIDGVFECINLDDENEENMTNDDVLFYIYNVDPICWEIDSESK
ncbi:MAG: hypothetical protein PHI70_05500 [Proteiniphilum sp.]|nr:hypothetical protein [Proteiniphilum sp.]